MIPKTNSRSRISKKPWRSEAYKLWVKENNHCLCCDLPSVDAHHIREMRLRTGGVRISDKYVVPLCLVHHAELHRHSRTFWAEQGINPVAWCEATHAKWEAS